MSGHTRRAFTAGALGLCIGMALDACTSPAPPSPYSGQWRTVALAAALENQAVSAYQAVGTALRAGKFGPPVPALSAFVKAATAHHVQHAATWNAILSKAHKPTVTGTPLSNNSAVMSAITGAPDAHSAIAAVHNLEIQAAQTYAAAIAGLTSLPAAVSAAATIAPAEAMHAAALGYLFGGQSTVVDFLGTGGAVSTNALTV